MREFISILGILSIIAVMGGCGKSENPQTGFSSFPHENGYRWEYRSKILIWTTESSIFKRTRYLDGTTVLPNGLTAQNFICTDEISAMTAKAVTTSAFGLPCSSAKTYCIFNDTGVYLYGTSNHSTTEANLILPLPLILGSSWQRGTDKATTFETVVEEEITVPAGTFKTIKITMKESGTSESGYYEWYADGVGMVKCSLLLTMISTMDSGGRIIPITGEGYYIEELTSKNF